MIDRFKKMSGRAIVCFSALFLIAVFLIGCTFSLVYESALRKRGKLTQTVYTFSDFEAYSFKDGENGAVITTDNDPQMILSGERYLTNIKFYMDYTVFPGEITLYYTQKQGQGFSERKRVWAKPVRGEDGYYEFDLPAKKVLSVRIDPTMYAGNELSFGDFVFNGEKSAADYYRVDYTHLYLLIVYTVILSSCIRFVQELFIKFTK